MVTSLKRPYKLEIKQTYQKGWGVFTTSPVYRGEIIEECPLLEVPDQVCQIYPEAFIDYAYGYPIKNPQLQVLSLGFGCIYNHSDTPNAKWQHHPLDSKIFQFIAIKDINLGEEVCVYYGDEKYWAQRPYIKKI
jgi:hypothetical protein